MTSTLHPLASVILRGETVVQSIQANARVHPDRPAMRRRGEGGWEVITWADYAQGVREVAAGLAELGIGPGEHVAILGNNRVEWHLADLGSLSNGCVTVPVYQTSSPTQVQYILGHGEARLCFVDSHAQLGKVLAVRDELPKLDRVILFDDGKRLDDIFVTGFDELRALGRQRIERDAAEVDARLHGVRPDDLATLVYTSGTTGPPKGTMISHGNIVWTLRNATPPFEIRDGERLLSFLPLSHIAERMMSDFMPIAVGGETWFAGSLVTVPQDLAACRPTVFFAVPRVWEKLREGIEQKVRTMPTALQRLVDRLIELGLEKVAAEQDGTSFGVVARTEYDVLDRLIGAKIRHELGLDEAHVMITAAAPTHPSLIRWFHALGLPVCELYGQTEDCGPATSNRPADNRIGTVGRALPGVSLRIAEDCEVLVKGGNVCLGYFKDAKATAALIDEDGWMHTGDMGVLDGDGWLRMTGRKKDLIITAAGKNIAPQDMETELRNHALISQAVVVGEGRSYLTALITLDPEELNRWAKEHDKLEMAEALAADPDVIAAVQSAVDDVNGRRSRAESIRKFRILPRDFTVAEGELTPTLKVKRNVVYDLHAEEIAELYAAA